MVYLKYPISPRPKQRPRFTKRGWAYTPKETRAFEDAIRLFTKANYQGQPLEGPLEVKLVFHVERPKTVKHPWPHKRCDLDNLQKGILDALNGVLYVDDGQVVRLYGEKRYGEPSIELWVTPVL